MATLLLRAKKGATLSCTSLPASSSTSTSPDYHQLSPDRRSSRELDRRSSLDLNWVSPLFTKKKAQLQKNRGSSGKPRETTSPAASTRYLLDDAGADALFDVFDELDLLPPSISIDPARFRSAAGDDSAALRPSSSSRSSSSSCSAAREQDQVRVGAASSSSPYILPSTRLIPIKKDDGSPFLRPSTASLPLPAFQSERRDVAPTAAAAVEESRFGRPQEQGFFGASSSSSSMETRLHTTVDEDAAVLKSSSSSSSAKSQGQVVVLRVSLHCKGCEAKVRKHISRMKGVTSFNVDFATKKVTVTGDVTPLGVISSISKVKSAQFWPE
ncbi:hypothetical protein Taro_041286 [Colocasia esculenta]|uniref:HMA domain-containing protein n=1 Tax=Colocasia esculenta TaxID=4460 RepID=A0A843WL80_COLES|nr:hypothetical protein [Colocasia esculenta]